MHPKNLWCWPAYLVLLTALLVTGGPLTNKKVIKRKIDIELSDDTDCNGKIVENVFKIFSKIPKTFDPNKSKQKHKPSIICWIHIVGTIKDQHGNVLDNLSQYTVSFETPKDIRANYVQTKLIDKHGKEKFMYIDPIETKKQIGNYTLTKRKIVTCSSSNRYSQVDVKNPDGTLGVKIKTPNEMVQLEPKHDDSSSFESDRPDFTTIKTLELLPKEVEGDQLESVIVLTEDDESVTIPEDGDLSTTVGKGEETVPGISLHDMPKLPTEVLSRDVNRDTIKYDLSTPDFSTPGFFEGYGPVSSSPIDETTIDILRDIMRHKYDDVSFVSKPEGKDKSPLVDELKSLLQQMQQESHSPESLAPGTTKDIVSTYEPDTSAPLNPVDEAMALVQQMLNEDSTKVPVSTALKDKFFLPNNSLNKYQVNKLKELLEQMMHENENQSTMLPATVNPENLENFVSIIKGGGEETPERDHDLKLSTKNLPGAINASHNKDKSALPKKSRVQKLKEVLHQMLDEDYDSNLKPHEREYSASNTDDESESKESIVIPLPVKDESKTFPKKHPDSDRSPDSFGPKELQTEIQSPVDSDHKLTTEVLKEGIIQSVLAGPEEPYKIVPVMVNLKKPPYKFSASVHLIYPPDSHSKEVSNIALVDDVVNNYLEEMLSSEESTELPSSSEEEDTTETGDGTATNDGTPMSDGTATIDRTKTGDGTATVDGTATIDGTTTTDRTETSNEATKSNETPKDFNVVQNTTTDKSPTDNITEECTTIHEEDSSLNEFPIRIISDTIDVFCVSADINIIKIECPSQVSTRITDELLPSNAHFTPIASFASVITPDKILVKGKLACYIIRTLREVDCPEKDALIVTINKIMEEPTTDDEGSSYSSEASDGSLPSVNILDDLCTESESLENIDAFLIKYDDYTFAPLGTTTCYIVNKTVLSTNCPPVKGLPIVSLNLYQNYAIIPFTLFTDELMAGNKLLAQENDHCVIFKLLNSNMCPEDNIPITTIIKAQPDFEASKVVKNAQLGETGEQQVTYPDYAVKETRRTSFLEDYATVPMDQVYLGTTEPPLHDNLGAQSENVSSLDFTTNKTHEISAPSSELSDGLNLTRDHRPIDKNNMSSLSTVSIDEKKTDREQVPTNEEKPEGPSVSIDSSEYQEHISPIHTGTVTTVPNAESDLSMIEKVDESTRPVYSSPTDREDRLVASAPTGPTFYEEDKTQNDMRGVETPKSYPNGYITQEELSTPLYKPRDDLSIGMEISTLTNQFHSRENVDEPFGLSTPSKDVKEFSPLEKDATIPKTELEAFPDEISGTTLSDGEEIKLTEINATIEYSLPKTTPIPKLNELPYSISTISDVDKITLTEINPTIEYSFPKTTPIPDLEAYSDGLSTTTLSDLEKITLTEINATIEYSLPMTTPIPDLKVFPALIKILHRSKNANTPSYLTASCQNINKFVAVVKCPENRRGIPVISETLIPPYARLFSMRAFKNLDERKLLVRGKRKCYIFTKAGNVNCPLDKTNLITIFINETTTNKLISPSELGTTPYPTKPYFTIKFIHLYPSHDNLEPEDTKRNCLDVSRYVKVVKCPKVDQIPTVDEKLPDNVVLRNFKGFSKNKRNLLVKSNNKCMVFRIIRKIICSTRSKIIPIYASQPTPQPAISITSEEKLSLDDGALTDKGEKFFSDVQESTTTTSISESTTIPTELSPQVKPYFTIKLIYFHFRDLQLRRDNKHFICLDIYRRVKLIDCLTIKKIQLIFEAKLPDHVILQNVTRYFKTKRDLLLRSFNKCYMFRIIRRVSCSNRSNVIPVYIHKLKHVGKGDESFTVVPTPSSSEPKEQTDHSSVSNITEEKDSKKLNVSQGVKSLIKDSKLPIDELSDYDISGNSFEEALVAVFQTSSSEEDSGPLEYLYTSDKNVVNIVTLAPTYKKTGEEEILGTTESTRLPYEMQPPVGELESEFQHEDTMKTLLPHTDKKLSDTTKSTDLLQMESTTSQSIYTSMSGGSEEKEHGSDLDSSKLGTTEESQTKDLLGKKPEQFLLTESPSKSGEDFQILIQGGRYTIPKVVQSPVSSGSSEESIPDDSDSKSDVSENLFSRESKSEDKSGKEIASTVIVKSETGEDLSSQESKSEDLSEEEMKANKLSTSTIYPGTEEKLPFGSNNIPEESTTTTSGSTRRPGEDSEKPGDKGQISAKIQSVLKKAPEDKGQELEGNLQVPHKSIETLEDLSEVKMKDSTVRPSTIHSGTEEMLLPFGSSNKPEEFTTVSSKLPQKLPAHFTIQVFYADPEHELKSGISKGICANVDNRVGVVKCRSKWHIPTFQKELPANVAIRYLTRYSRNRRNLLVTKDSKCYIFRIIRKVPCLKRSQIIPVYIYKASVSSDSDEGETTTLMPEFGTEESLSLNELQIGDWSTKSPFDTFTATSDDEENFVDNFKSEVTKSSEGSQTEEPSSDKDNYNVLTSTEGFKTTTPTPSQLHLEISEVDINDESISISGEVTTEAPKPQTQEYFTIKLIHEKTEETQDNCLDVNKKIKLINCLKNKKYLPVFREKLPKSVKLQYAPRYSKNERHLFVTNKNNCFMFIIIHEVSCSERSGVIPVYMHDTDENSSASKPRSLKSMEDEKDEMHSLLSDVIKKKQEKTGFTSGLLSVLSITESINPLRSSKEKKTGTFEPKSEASESVQSEEDEDTSSLEVETFTIGPKPLETKGNEFSTLNSDTSKKTSEPINASSILKNNHTEDIPSRENSHPKDLPDTKVKKDTLISTASPLEAKTKKTKISSPGGREEKLHVNLNVDNSEELTNIINKPKLHLSSNNLLCNDDDISQITVEESESREKLTDDSSSFPAYIVNVYETKPAERQCVNINKKIRVLKKIDQNMLIPRINDLLLPKNVKFTFSAQNTDKKKPRIVTRGTFGYYILTIDRVIPCPKDTGNIFSIIIMHKNASDTTPIFVPIPESKQSASTEPGEITTVVDSTIVSGSTTGPVEDFKESGDKEQFPTKIQSILKKAPKGKRPHLGADLQVTTESAETQHEDDSSQEVESDEDTTSASMLIHSTTVPGSTKRPGGDFDEPENKEHIPAKIQSVLKKTPKEMGPELGTAHESTGIQHEDKHSEEDRVSDGDTSLEAAVSEMGSFLTRVPIYYPNEPTSTVRASEELESLEVSTVEPKISEEKQKNHVSKSVSHNHEYDIFEPGKSPESTSMYPTTVHNFIYGHVTESSTTDESDISSLNTHGTTNWPSTTFFPLENLENQSSPFDMEKTQERDTYEDLQSFVADHSLSPLETSTISSEIFSSVEVTTSHIPMEAEGVNFEKPTHSGNYGMIKTTPGSKEKISPYTAEPDLTHGENVFSPEELDTTLKLFTTGKTIHFSDVDGQNQGEETGLSHMHSSPGITSTEAEETGLTQKFPFTENTVGPDFTHGSTIEPDLTHDEYLFSPEVLGAAPKLSTTVGTIHFPSTGDRSLEEEMELTHMQDPSKENTIEPDIVHDAYLFSPEVLGTTPKLSTTVGTIHLSYTDDHIQGEEMGLSHMQDNSQNYDGMMSSPGITSTEGTDRDISSEERTRQPDSNYLADNLSTPVGKLVPDLKNNLSTLDGKFVPDSGVDLEDNLLSPAVELTPGSEVYTDDHLSTTIEKSTPGLGVYSDDNLSEPSGKLTPSSGIYFEDNFPTPGRELTPELGVFPTRTTMSLSTKSAEKYPLTLRDDASSEDGTDLNPTENLILSTTEANVITTESSNFLEEGKTSTGGYKDFAITQQAFAFSEGTTEAVITKESIPTKYDPRESTMDKTTTAVNDLYEMLSTSDLSPSTVEETWFDKAALGDGDPYGMKSGEEAGKTPSPTETIRPRSSQERVAISENKTTNKKDMDSTPLPSTTSATTSEVVKPTSSPILVKHETDNNRVRCYEIDNHINLRQVECPKDTSKTPSIVNPALIKLICPKRVKHHIKQPNSLQILRRFNMVLHDPVADVEIQSKNPWKEF